MSILLSFFNLKTKIIATVLLLFLGSIWTLTFFKTLFRSGLTVISKEGNGIADYPEMPGRSTASYKEIDYRWLDR